MQPDAAAQAKKTDAPTPDDAPKKQAAESSSDDDVDAAGAAARDDAGAGDAPSEAKSSPTKKSPRKAKKPSKSDLDAPSTKDDDVSELHVSWHGISVYFGYFIQQIKFYYM